MAKSAKAQKQRYPRPVPSAGADVIPISQPSSRQSIQWTPSLLKQVSMRADGGDLSLLTDLCEQIVADDRFGELLGQLADDVLGCELSFETSPRTIVGSAEKARELIVDWARGYDDDELKNIIVWAMVTGVAFAKHETWVESQGRVVPVLKWWHPQHFGFRPREGSSGLGGSLKEHDWHVRDGNGKWTPIKPGDGTWVIITRRSEYYPWRNGLWRGLGVWWLLKQYAIQDSGVHSERAAKTVVTTGEGSTVEDRKALANYIYSAGKDPVVALPDGCDLKIVEIQANLEQTYHAQIRLANESAALTILGQNLSTTVEGGSFAAAKEHSRKESRRVRNAAQMLSKGLRAQSLAWWAEFNFGNRDLAPFPRWHTEPEQDYAVRAGVLQQTATALLTLKTAGWEIDEETVEEQFGIILKKTKALVAREQAEPGDTDGDGIPHNEPGNVNPAKASPDAPGGVKGDKEPKSKGDKPPKVQPPRPRPPKPPSTPTPPTALDYTLASGDDPSAAQGFVQGQIYADVLTERQVELIAGELAPFVDRILEAIDGAEDYDDVRYRVIKAFQDEPDPRKMATIIERSLLLADLAGRHAVMQDMPDDSLESREQVSISDRWETDVDLEAKYNPKQPRHPKGSRQGGQWSGSKGAGGAGSGGAGSDYARDEAAVRERISNIQPHRDDPPAADHGKLNTAADKAQDGMTDSERNAVDAWMSISYGDIRAADMGDLNASDEARRQASTIRRLTSEFDYEPTGAVFRGLRVDPETAHKLLDSTTMNLDSMTSWSASNAVAKQFAMGTATGAQGTSIQVVMTMTKPRGLPLGGAEAELVVPKGTYRVLSRSNDKGVLRIHIEHEDANSRLLPTITDSLDLTLTAAEKKRRKKKHNPLERFGSTGDDISFPEDGETPPRKRLDSYDEDEFDAHNPRQPRYPKGHPQGDAIGTPLVFDKEGNHVSGDLDDDEEEDADD